MAENKTPPDQGGVSLFGKIGSMAAKGLSAIGRAFGFGRGFGAKPSDVPPPSAPAPKTPSDPSPAAPQANSEPTPSPASDASPASPTPPTPSKPTPFQSPTRPTADDLDKPDKSSPYSKFMLGKQEYSGFKSSNVAAAQYDPKDYGLEIGFKNGGWYRYHDVSPTLAKSFYDAGSKGKWVWDKLRLRGTVFGHQKPYVYLGGKSQGYTPKYAQTRQGIEQHRTIGPEGTTPLDWRQGRGPYHPSYGIPRPGIKHPWGDSPEEIETRPGQRKKPSANDELQAAFKSEQKYRKSQAANEELQAAFGESEKDRQRQKEQQKPSAAPAPKQLPAIIPIRGKGKADVFKRPPKGPQGGVGAGDGGGGLSIWGKIKGAAAKAAGFGALMGGMFGQHKEKGGDVEKQGGIGGEIVYATPGERMFDRETAQANLPLLESINQDGLQAKSESKPDNGGLPVDSVEGLQGVPDGGSVAHQRGDGGDTEPVKAKDGAFVVNKDASVKHKDTLDAIAQNKGEKGGLLSAVRKPMDWMKERYGVKPTAAALAFGQAATWGASAGLTAMTGMPIMLPPGSGKKFEGGGQVGGQQKDDYSSALYKEHSRTVRRENKQGLKSLVRTAFKGLPVVQHEDGTYSVSLHGRELSIGLGGPNMDVANMSFDYEGDGPGGEGKSQKDKDDTTFATGKELQPNSLSFAKKLKAFTGMVADSGLKIGYESTGRRTDFYKRALEKQGLTQAESQAGINSVWKKKFDKGGLKQDGKRRQSMSVDEFGKANPHLPESAVKGAHLHALENAREQSKNLEGGAKEKLGRFYDVPQEVSLEHTGLTSRWKEEDSEAEGKAKVLYQIVQDMGGISMDSLDAHGFDTKAYRESGLGGLFRKDGGRDISEIAGQLHQEGHVNLPDVEYHGTGADRGKQRQKTLQKDAAEHVMELLKNKTQSLHVSVDDQLKREEKKHFKEQQDAKKFGFTPSDIEPPEGASKEDSYVAGEEGDAYEGPDRMAEEDELPYHREERLRRESELAKWREDPNPLDIPEPKPVEAKPKSEVAGVPSPIQGQGGIADAMSATGSLSKANESRSAAERESAALRASRGMADSGYSVSTGKEVEKNQGKVKGVTVAPAPVKTDDSPGVSFADQQKQREAELHRSMYEKATGNKVEQPKAEPPKDETQARKMARWRQEGLEKAERLRKENPERYSVKPDYVSPFEGKMHGRPSEAKRREAEAAKKPVASSSRQAQQIPIDASAGVKHPDMPEPNSTASSGVPWAIDQPNAGLFGNEPGSESASTNSALPESGNNENKRGITPSASDDTAKGQRGTKSTGGIGKPPNDKGQAVASDDDNEDEGDNQQGGGWFGRVIGGAKQAGVDLREGLGDIGSGIKGGVGSARKWIGRAASTVSKGAKSAASGIVGMGGKAARGIGSGFMDVVGNDLGEGVRDIASGVGAAADWTKRKIKGVRGLLGGKKRYDDKTQQSSSADRSNFAGDDESKTTSNANGGGVKPPNGKVSSAGSDDENEGDEQEQSGIGSWFGKAARAGGNVLEGVGNSTMAAASKIGGVGRSVVEGIGSGVDSAASMSGIKLPSFGFGKPKRTRRAKQKPVDANDAVDADNAEPESDGRYAGYPSPTSEQPRKRPVELMQRGGMTGAIASAMSGGGFKEVLGSYFAGGSGTMGAIGRTMAGTTSQDLYEESMARTAKYRGVGVGGGEGGGGANAEMMLAAKELREAAKELKGGGVSQEASPFSVRGDNRGVADVVPGFRDTQETYGVEGDTYGLAEDAYSLVSPRPSSAPMATPAPTAGLNVGQLLGIGSGGPPVPPVGLPVTGATTGAASGAASGAAGAGGGMLAAAGPIGIAAMAGVAIFSKIAEVGGKVVDVFVGLTKAAMDPAGALRGLAAPIQSQVANFNPGIIERFNLALDNASAAVGSIFAPVIDGMREFADEINVITTGMGPGLRDMVTSVIPLVRDAMRGGLQGFSYAIQAVTETLTPIFQELRGANIGGIVAELFRNVGGNVADFIKALRDGYGVANDLWQSISGGKTVIESAVDAVRLFTAALSVGRDLTQEAYGTLKGWGSGIKSWLGEMKDTAAQWGVELISMLPEGVRTWFGELYNGIIAFKDGVMEFIRTLPGAQFIMDRWAAANARMADNRPITGQRTTAAQQARNIGIEEVGMEARRSAFSQGSDAQQTAANTAATAASLQQIQQLLSQAFPGFAQAANGAQLLFNQAGG